MDHLLSDMNACSSHLLMFFKAKWIDGEFRQCVREEEDKLITMLSPSQYPSYYFFIFLLIEKEKI